MNDNKGIHVFVHVLKDGQTLAHNEGRYFRQVPAVGEYFMLDWNLSWNRVMVVAHCPFKAEYEAEVYAIQVDHNECLKHEWLDIATPAKA